MKKTIAFLLVLGMLLSLAACTEAAPAAPAEPAAEAAEPAAPEAENAGETKADRSAAAVELGGRVITAGEIEDAYKYFQSYMSYYGMSLGEDQQQQYLDMIVSDQIADLATAWQADMKGLKLDEAQLKEVEAQVEESRAKIMADYIDFAKEELGEDAGEEELNAKALELINQDVVEYTGLDFESYLDSTREGFVKTALENMLKQSVEENVSVTEEQIKAFYEEKLAADREEMEKDPAAYESLAVSNADGTLLPGLVIPEGYRRAQVVPFALSEEEQTASETTGTEKTALEAEFGALVLKNEDPARQAEIRARYQELLKAEAETMDRVRAEAQKLLNEAKADGADFGALMKEHGEYTEEQLTNGWLVYTGEQGTAYPAAVLAKLRELQPGETALVEDGSTVYVCRLVAVEEARELSLEEMLAATAAAALDAARETEWNEMVDTWKEAAGLAALKHPDVYAYIIR